MNARLAASILTVTALTALGEWLPASAQQAMTPEQQKAAMANDPKLFLKVARTAMKWDEAAEPTRIAGPIHFVGTKGLSVWLITGSEGHVLLNTGMQDSGPMIESSIRKLGFDPKDIKWLLAGHAHVDHVAGHAYLKKLTGASVAIAAEEVGLMESGSKGDFNYDGVPGFDFAPVKVDRVLGHDRHRRRQDLQRRVSRRFRCQPGLSHRQESVLSGNRGGLPADVPRAGDHAARHLAPFAHRHHGV
jgi:hypothetical protein